MDYLNITFITKISSQLREIRNKHIGTFHNMPIHHQWSISQFSIS